MARSNTGRLGEDAAAEFLRGTGYEIAERNYCTRFGEIDIIATRENYIIFAEVKTRKTNSMLLPREAVNAKKQRRLIMATKMYLSCHDIGTYQPRFDVIEVTTRTGSAFKVDKINHIESAFTL